MKVTLLALTLNEIDGVRAIMPRISREWFDQILILDGGSTDGTVEWARTTTAIRSTSNAGLGHSLRLP